MPEALGKTGRYGGARGLAEASISRYRFAKGGRRRGPARENGHRDGGRTQVSAGKGMAAMGSSASRRDATGGDAAGGLDLPPGFRAIGLRELRTAMTHAAGIAATEGAGTLVHVRRFDTIEYAVVLEPEEPLAEARRAIYAVMNATADALAFCVPPEKPVTFDWPDTVRVDGGIVGGAMLAWPPGTAETEVPDWLVAGVVLRSVMPLIGGSRNPYDVQGVSGTGLDLEGVELIDGTELIEGFCRHLLLQFDRWRDPGFAEVGAGYLKRLPEARARRRELAENGDLVERGLGGDDVIARHDLVAALAAPRWRDPATGEPWL